MKVLILSWYFPPSNTIGAIRVGKLAKYLMRRNVDVRVVTAREPDLSKTLPLEIPAERVTWTRAIDVNRLNQRTWIDVTLPQAYTDITQGDLVDTYAHSTFEDTRRKAAKFGAMGSTIGATKPELSG